MRFLDHTDTPRSVGVPWTSDRPITETFTGQRTTITRERETSVHLAGFEPAIPASESLQTHSLDRGATVIGTSMD